MNPERLVAGLDIGSAKTTAIIAEVVGDLPKHPSIRVLGVGSARTAGLRKGVVSDIEETTRSIQQAMTDAERMAGVEVEFVYAGIAGEHVQAMTSQGVVAVNGEEVTRADVERAHEVARAQPIPTDRELLHAMPQEYQVDKEKGIRDPVGMIGARLPYHRAGTRALAFPPAIEHRPTREHDGRDVDRCRRHQTGRRGLVAAGREHDAVERIAIKNFDQAEISEITVERRCRPLAGLLQRMHRKFEGDAAGRADAGSHAFGEFEVMAIAG